MTPHRVVVAFELAELEDDAARRAARLTFAVIGAGPTGVEMAGQIAELARHSLPSNFRRIDTAAARPERTITGQQIFARQALAASVRGGDVDG